MLKISNAPTNAITRKRMTPYSATERKLKSESVSFLLNALDVDK